MTSVSHTCGDNPRCASQEGELQLFTLWSQGSGLDVFADREGSALASHNICKGPSLSVGGWMVVIVASEVVRRNPAGASVAPLFRRQLVAHRERVSTSRLRARIAWMRAGQGACVDVDIGSGVRLGIESDHVDVKILGPQGRMWGANRLSTGLGNSEGIYLDTLVVGHVVPCAVNCTERGATLTQVVSVAAGAQRELSIPAFARGVRVHLSSPGALEPLGFVLGQGGPLVRALPFAGFDRQARSQLLPQQATHLSTGADPANDRVFTVVWELRF